MRTFATMTLAAFVLLLAACRDRCLLMEVRSTLPEGVSFDGQVRVVLETPSELLTRYDDETDRFEQRVVHYASHGTQAVASAADEIHAWYCAEQSQEDDLLVRVAAWVEPEGSEPRECAERWVCPPEGATYAETLVTFAKEGVSYAVVELPPPAKQ